MSAELRRLAAALHVLPVGVIIVDESGAVVEWNHRAEEFVECVGRPTLHRGMTLEDAHPEGSRRPMKAMVERLREGKEFSCKRVEGAGRVFRVWYHPLHASQGEYLGVAQVIEFVEEVGT